ncbi:effector-associated domain EAD1-containing protein [Pseudofrankia inefficax]|uniref:effector-associated domain EAD1-containing protein n=1 Tax=Pseudofrankia inefficax (strain DSM 45817 / CECT 9037 / DDB 130130 / EuI1c) TaxID=298654 RepID=UPI0012FD5C25|nr:effector-associated domain EAD1-containing protein [Pseudofrankia inefficax]
MDLLVGCLVLHGPQSRYLFLGRLAGWSGTSIDVPDLPIGRQWLLALVDLYGRSAAGLAHLPDAARDLGVDEETATALAALVARWEACAAAPHQQAPHQQAPHQQGPHQQATAAWVPADHAARSGPWPAATAAARPRVAAEGPLTEEEVAALTSAFADQTAAGQLLSDAGLRAERQPSWRVNTAEEFWVEVAALVRDGILPDGRARILTAAASRLPDHPVLARDPGDRAARSAD